MRINAFIVKGISTFLGVGYLPFIPGTFGSLIAVILFYFIAKDITVLMALTAAIIALGFLVGTKAEELFKTKDARYIVIDEVGGMLLGLLFIPHNLKLIVIAFFLFRLFDTLKPYPAGRLQDLKGSTGIMIDDIIAGLYTNIVLQIVLRLAGGFR